MNSDVLDPVDAAVAAIARGEMVVVVDDADRENEGDLIAAASKVTPEQIAFMVRHTSGIICAPPNPGGGAAAQTRSDGDDQRRAAWHRLHDLH